MRNKLLLIALASLSALLSAGCTIQLPDTEFCADLGSEGAACFHVFSDSERVLESEKWEAERFGMVCTTSESFAEWKAVVRKLCYEARCTQSQKREILRTFSLLESKIEAAHATKGLR